MTEKVLSLGAALTMGENSMASAQELEEACEVVSSAKSEAQEALQGLEEQKRTSVSLVAAGNVKAISQLATDIQEAQIKHESLVTAYQGIEARLQRRRAVDEAEAVSAQWEEVRKVLAKRERLAKKLEDTVKQFAADAGELHALAHKALQIAPLEKIGVARGMVRRELQQAPFWDPHLVVTTINRFTAKHDHGYLMERGSLARSWPGHVSLQEEARRGHAHLLSYADTQEEPHLPEAA